MGDAFVSRACFFGHGSQAIARQPGAEPEIGVAIPAETRPRFGFVLTDAAAGFTLRERNGGSPCQGDRPSEEDRPVEEDFPARGVKRFFPGSGMNQGRWDSGGPPC